MSPFRSDSSTQRIPVGPWKLGFSQKICLSGIDAGGQHLGRKPGGVANKHHVDAAVDYFLVRIQSEKLVRLLDFDAVRNLANSLQGSQRAINMGLVHISDRC